MKKLFIHFLKGKISWFIATFIFLIIGCVIVNNMNINLLYENNLDYNNSSLLAKGVIYFLFYFSPTTFLVKLSTEILLLLITLIPISNTIEILLSDMAVLSFSRIKRDTWLRKIYLIILIYNLVFGLIYLVIIIIVTSCFNILSIIPYFISKILIILLITYILLFLNINCKKALYSTVISISLYAFINMVISFVLKVSVARVIVLSVIICIIIVNLYIITKSKLLKKDIGGD